MAYEPNLSIIVPGPCNAKCDFCFWKHTKDIDPDYIYTLKNVLNSMPDEFYQLSLTGGEPTISKYIRDIFAIIDRKKYTKVVLSTNGTDLISLLDDIYGQSLNRTFIDHINISRHHKNDLTNQVIFNSRSVPSEKALHTAILACHDYGIDVTLNCVLTDFMKTSRSIGDYLNWAREIGADAVAFRKQHGTLEPSPQENYFLRSPIINESSCPVCRSKSQRINGIPVIWKTSCIEPSEVVTDEVYEAIIHPNGKVTLDWAGNKPYVLPTKEMNMSKNIRLARIAEALILIGQELKAFASSEESDSNSVEHEDKPIVKKVKERPAPYPRDKSDNCRSTTGGCGSGSNRGCGR